MQKAASIKVDGRKRVTRGVKFFVFRVSSVLALGMIVFLLPQGVKNTGLVLEP